MSVTERTGACWALIAALAGCTQGADTPSTTPSAPAGVSGRTAGGDGNAAVKPGDSSPGAAAPADAAPAARVPGDPASGGSSGEAGPPAAAEGDVDVAKLVGEPAATDLAAAPIRLPAGWNGKGVLARRSGKVPKRAPAWARIEAQMLEHDGQRFLVTSGRVKNIKDVQLARSTAENRARSLLSAWTKSDRQAGGAIREVWRDSRTGETFAQVELAVPEDWVPGTALTKN